MTNELSKNHRTYAEIDNAAIRHNGNIIKATFPEKKILFVMKAAAYGHGIDGIMPAAEDFEKKDYAVGRSRFTPALFGETLAAFEGLLNE
jgi:alanine racemase